MTGLPSSSRTATIVPGQALPSAPGLTGNTDAQLPMQHVELGLAEPLVDDATEELLGPAEQVGADGLTARARPRGMRQPLARQSAGPDHPQRRGGQQRERHLELAHQPDGARSALNTVSSSTTTGSPYHHAGTRMSMIPAIHAQSAGDQMTSLGLRVEVVDGLEAGDVAEHEAVGVQGALRVAGRARGVDEEGTGPPRRCRPA